MLISYNIENCSECHYRKTIKSVFGIDIRCTKVNKEVSKEDKKLDFPKFCPFNKKEKIKKGNKNEL